jgi:hypothetical protein
MSAGPARLGAARADAGKISAIVQIRFFIRRILYESAHPKNEALTIARIGLALGGRYRSESSGYRVADCLSRIAA